MRTKVTLIVFLASIVVFIFAESITFKYEFKRIENEVTRLSLISAHLISDYCGLLLLNDNTSDIKFEIEDFSRLPFVYDAIAIDTKGTILGEYHRSKDSCETALSNYKNNYSKGFVHITVPITFNRSKLGNLYVRSFVDIKPLISDILKCTAIIILIQLLFAFLLIYLFHRYISNPISYLIRVTQRIINDKNYSRRINKTSFDEIGELYDEFNNLLETIDVHGQKRSIAESELYKSNERYKTLVNNIPGVVFQIVYDKGWRIGLIGEGITALTGYSVDDFIGKDEKAISNILSEESQKILFARLKNHIGKNKETESVYIITTKAGHPKWILIRGRFVYSSETNITTIDGILFDNTDKVLAQDLLKKTEKRYHDLFENLNDAAFLVEMESGFIVETNKEGENLLGYKRKEIVDKLKKDVLCIKDIENSENIDSMSNFYDEIKHSSGKNIPVHVLSSIVAIGEKNHLLCLVHDVSERMEYEHNLKIAKEKAEESDNLKSMFLSNISHEIRTPLNGFIGFSKLILSSKSKEETESYISIIDGCGKQLLRVIEDILDVSRIETGQMTFYNEEFSLNLLLDEIKMVIDAQILRVNKTNIIIELNKGLFDEYDMIYSDRTRLYQVIVNIASNAVKFTENGKISISYKPEHNGKLKFKISDTGMGIESEKIDLIFNRFTQANRSIAVKYGGSGLGLSIAKGIVELMGGEIWFESEIGKGSTFYFTIKQNKKETTPLQ